LPEPPEEVKAASLGVDKARTSNIEELEGADEEAGDWPITEGPREAKYGTVGSL
jgi:hypothetical protein